MFSEWLMFVFKIITVIAVLVLPVILVIVLTSMKKGNGAGHDDEGHYEVRSLFKDLQERNENMDKALHMSRFDPDDDSDELQDKSSQDKSLQEKPIQEQITQNKVENKKPKQTTSDKSQEQSKAQDNVSVTADATVKATSEKKAKIKKKSRRLLKKERLEKQKAQLKERQERIKKAQQAGEFCPRDLYVLDYDGNVKATGNEALRREIDAVLAYADERDEVVLRLTSPGGVVNGYGLAASELARLRARNIHLTVCVDEVAASGGYMMASVAEKIVASPFAYIGSIGVVMSVPNFNKVLKKYDVDYEQLTAGKYKRTVTMFGENTDEAREKCRAELEAVHKRFKALVGRYRPNLDLEKTATGEYWLAQDALELGLVDAIETSDDYIGRRLALTSRSALTIEWDEEQKTSRLQKILKFFSAKAWVQAIADELEKRLVEKKDVWR